MLIYLKQCVNKYNSTHYYINIIRKKSSYAKTVLLPQTKFPLRLKNKKLIERDAFINNSPQFTSLYNWQRTHLHGPEFILHDGPPYANGLPHMGHAINKILKDVIVRYKILQKQRVNYVPGWDCHGLPIELKAVTDKIKQTNRQQVRKRARNYAQETIEKQKKAFLSWGVTGDWQNAYVTYSPVYVKNQLKQFYNLYEKNFIYRDLKPVYWSPSSKTALAEAELEYNTNHKSTAVTLKVKLKKTPKHLEEYSSPLYALVWTTTPWTLPSNQAICYNSELSYSIVHNSSNQENYILATNLVESTSKMLNTELKILQTFPGYILRDATYLHPIFISKELKFLPASHAVETKGTGLVHTAPAHGPDDFIVALDNNIPVECLVDESGFYTSDAGANLENLFVLSDGTKEILNLCQKNIIHITDYVHSYPYDWRTKQPVILRASKQWFIDTNAIKKRAEELFNNVNIIPRSESEAHRRHFITQLQKRPYWCISRQRAWGVPIPVFYNKSSEKPIVSRDIIENLYNLMDKHGPDYWWTLPLNELLPDTILKNHNLNIEDIQKGEDIFDIWFDSGMSWSSVLGDGIIADMYLEGVDQFTGWFQSSLLTSVALRDKAPFKTIYVHGFAVDENGLKMSKSLGNVIDPQIIIQGSKQKEPFGIDTLRWWVACHANQDSIAYVSNNVLQASCDEVQKVRSILRFALGSLTDYENTDIDYTSLKIIDKYVLHLLSVYQKQVLEYLVDYQFNKINALVLNFLTNSISALYYTSIKDRLYCEMPESLSRQSAQYVLLHLFYIITKSIAPIVPHLAEELFMYLPQRNHDSLFQTDLDVMPLQWKSQDINDLMDKILIIKKDINKIAGAATLNKSIKLLVSKELYAYFKDVYPDTKSFCLELADIYQVAEVHLIEDSLLVAMKYAIEVQDSNLKICERCRKCASTIENELCNRCTLIVESFNNKQAYTT